MRYALLLIPDVVPLRFCRSDPRFANVIARPHRRVGLVDWEDSGLHDPACEFADLLGPEGWQPFPDRYLASCRDDPRFGERLRGYLALFPVFWLGVLLAEGLRRAESHTLDGWLVNNLDPNLRGRR